MKISKTKTEVSAKLEIDKACHTGLLINSMVDG